MAGAGGRNPRAPAGRRRAHPDGRPPRRLAPRPRGGTRPHPPYSGHARDDAGHARGGRADGRGGGDARRRSSANGSGREAPNQWGLAPAGRRRHRPQPTAVRRGGVRPPVDGRPAALLTGGAARTGRSRFANGRQAEGHRQPGGGARQGCGAIRTSCRWATTPTAAGKVGRTGRHAAGQAPLPGSDQESPGRPGLRRRLRLADVPAALHGVVPLLMRSLSAEPRSEMLS